MPPVGFEPTISAKVAWSKVTRGTLSFSITRVSLTWTGLLRLRSQWTLFINGLSHTCDGYYAIWATGVKMEGWMTGQSFSWSARIFNVIFYKQGLKITQKSRYSTKDSTKITPKTSWEVLSTQYKDRNRGSQSQLYFDCPYPLFYLYIKKECHA